MRLPYREESDFSQTRRQKISYLRRFPVQVVEHFSAGVPSLSTKKRGKRGWEKKRDSGGFSPDVIRDTR